MSSGRDQNWGLGRRKRSLALEARKLVATNFRSRRGAEVAHTCRRRLLRSPTFGHLDSTRCGPSLAVRPLRRLPLSATVAQSQLNRQLWRSNAKREKTRLEFAPETPLSVSQPTNLCIAFRPFATPSRPSHLLLCSSFFPPPSAQFPVPFLWTCTLHEIIHNGASRVQSSRKLRDSTELTLPSPLCFYCKR